MQIVLQPHSSYLGRMTEEYAGVVVVIKGDGISVGGAVEERWR